MPNILKTNQPVKGRVGDVSLREVQVSQVRAQTEDLSHLEGEIIIFILFYSSHLTKLCITIFHRQLITIINAQLIVISKVTRSVQQTGVEINPRKTFYPRQQLKRSPILWRNRGLGNTGYKITIWIQTPTIRVYVY